MWQAICNNSVSLASTTATPEATDNHSASKNCFLLLTMLLFYGERGVLKQAMCLAPPKKHVQGWCRRSILNSLLLEENICRTPTESCDQKLLAKYDEILSAMNHAHLEHAHHHEGPIDGVVVPVLVALPSLQTRTYLLQVPSNQSPSPFQPGTLPVAVHMTYPDSQKRWRDFEMVYM